MLQNTGKPAATEPGHDVYTVVTCNYVPIDHPQMWPDKGESLRLVSTIDHSQTFPVEGESFRVVPAPPSTDTNETNPNPFLVALVLDDQQFCSGTLVSNRHVVTSAHCTRG